MSAGCWGKSHIELYLKLEKNVFKLGETIKVRDLPKAKVFGRGFSVFFIFVTSINHYNVINCRSNMENTASVDPLSRFTLSVQSKVADLKLIKLL